MNTIPRAIAAGAAIGLLSLAVPTDATAAAQRGKANVDVTIHVGPEYQALTGRVKSHRASCERHRTVKVWWKEESTSDWVQPPNATDESNYHGEWKVTALDLGDSIQNGKYYVKVGSNSHCESAKSRTITVAR